CLPVAGEIDECKDCGQPGEENRYPESFVYRREGILAAAPLGSKPALQQSHDWSPDRTSPTGPSGVRSAETTRGMPARSLVTPMLVQSGVSKSGGTAGSELWPSSRTRIPPGLRCAADCATRSA